MKLPYLLSGCLLLSVVACKQDRQIKVYHLAKENASAPTVQPPAAADPHAGMPGMAPGTIPPAAGGDPHAGLSAEQLAAASPPSSPRFSDTPPAHWNKQALSAMRLASYSIQGDGGTTADISFSILRQAPGGTLANVNRWREQLGQPPLDEAALAQASEAIKTTFGEGIVVDIEGLPAGADAAKDGRLIGVIADNAGSTWFFKMRGNAVLAAAEKDNFIKWIGTVKPALADAATAPNLPAPAVASAPAADASVTWQVPAGWTLAPAASTMRYATFGIAAADGTKGEIIVSHFPGDVGGDLENVNRWRQQVTLPPVDAAGMAPLISKLTAGPKTLSVVDMTGPQSRLVAGWTLHGADTWFFKFTGPDALVGAEKAKFTAFLESVRFTHPE
jgi:hypothetical protein